MILRTAPAWVLSMGCSRSGVHWSSVEPHRFTGLADKSALVWTPLHEPQFLPETCSCMGSARGQSLLQGTSICSDMGSSMGCRRITCTTTVFSTGCGGISSPVPGAPLPTTFSLTLGSPGLFLSHFLTPPLQLLLCSIFHP